MRPCCQVSARPVRDERQRRGTYVPGTLELDDLVAVLVEDDLTRGGSFAVLDDDEEEGAGSDGERVPLCGCVLPCLDEPPWETCRYMVVRKEDYSL